jgi:hypothetical protein
MILPPLLLCFSLSATRGAAVATHSISSIATLPNRNLTFVIPRRAASACAARNQSVSRINADDGLALRRKRHRNKTRTAWDVKHAHIRPRFGKLHHFFENAESRDDFHRRVGLGLTAELL